MKIRKAVFPVAGFGTRFLPATKAMPKELLHIVDKPLILYAVEEAIAAGIEGLLHETLSTNTNTGSPRCFPDGKEPRTFLLRACLPKQCGSSLWPYSFGGSFDKCALPIYLQTLCCLRNSCSSSLHAFYHEPEILHCSIPQICPKVAKIRHTGILGVKCRRELTRELQKLSLRIDPCTYWQPEPAPLKRLHYEPNNLTTPFGHNLDGIQQSNGAGLDHKIALC